MFCSKCGHENANNDAYCAKCGAALGTVFTEKNDGTVAEFDGTQALAKPPAAGQASAPSAASAAAQQGASEKKGPRTLNYGRYTVIRELGAGGMGRVYLAKDEKMEMDIVIKEMLPYLATPKEREYIKKHFKEEAKMLYRLKHAGLPRVTDYFFEGESIYIIMEYIRGDNLEDIIKSRPEGRITADEFFLWIVKVLDVLKYLHNQEPPIIHRDIKPGNIMLTPSNNIYLVDFGVAKAIAGKTVTQTRVGTPGFASPEHFFGKFIISSDIYSLGATFHYLLTGDDPRSRNPFDYPPLNLYRDDVPDELQKIMDKMLETEREYRYENVDEVLADLNTLSRKLVSQGSLSPEAAPMVPGVVAPPAEGEAPAEGAAQAPVPFVSGDWNFVEDIVFDGAVCAVEFSPDNKFVVCGTGSNQLEVLDAETREILHTISGHTDWIRTLAFSPDGRYVASGGDDQTIQVWDPKSGKNSKTLVGHEDWVRSISYAPDGSFMASGSYDKKVKIWSARSWGCIVDIDVLEESVNCVAYSPNSKVVAAGCDDAKIYLFNARTGELLNSLDAHDSYVYCLAFSPDGRFMASGSGDQLIKIWDLSSGENVLDMVGHEDSVLSLAFSPDGARLVSGSDDMTARVWLLKTGDCEKVMEGHTYSVYDVAISPEGNKIITASGDKTIRFWEIK